MGTRKQTISAKVELEITKTELEAANRRIAELERQLVQQQEKALIDLIETKELIDYLYSVTSKEARACFSASATP